MTDTELTWLPGPLIADFPDNSTKHLNHNGTSIVIIQWEGKFTAFRNQCLHQEMPIHAGFLLNGTLLCPWHNWGYDVRTGACQVVEGASLEEFRVRITDGQLWIGVKVIHS